MNVLFLTLFDIRSIKEHGIYPDLMREFVLHGNEVYIVSPTERRNSIDTCVIDEEHAHILKLKTGNIQKTNNIEKGISTLLIEYQIIIAIKKYFSNVKFDLVLYSTPPITIVKPIKYIRKRDYAKSYLMLKDIFPQNAVDLEMMSITGLKGLLYKYFRNKEKDLYAVSDRIGCMSQANLDYVIKHNPQIDPNKVEICPNAIEVQDISLTKDERIQMRNKYGLPLEKKIFVYGGNLGKPQGIPFIIDCLRAEKDNDKSFFLIVGDGTEYSKLEEFVNNEKPSNVKLLKRLPKDEFDIMIAACDVGLIFLDYRFTIPNFPSRLLSYMQAGLPIFACTDINTDIGNVIVDGEFGWWCESKDSNAFVEKISYICNMDIDEFSKKSKNKIRDYCVGNIYGILVGENNEF